MRKRLNTLLTPPKALDWSSMAYDAVMVALVVISLVPLFFRKRQNALCFQPTAFNW